MADLASDLRRVQSRRDIVWRRPPLRHRLANFCARNRAAVVVGGVAFLLLVTLGVRYVADLREQTARTQRALGESQRLLAVIVSNQRSALDQVGRPDLMESTGIEVQEYFSNLADEDLDPEVRRVQISSHTIQGDALLRAGAPAAAIEAYERALEVGERLRRAASPADPVHHDHAVTLLKLGNARRQRLDREQAARDYERGVALLRAWLGHHPQDAGGHDNLGTLLYLLGGTRHELGDQATGMRWLDEAIAVQRVAVSLGPEEPEARFHLAVHLSERAKRSTLALQDRRQDVVEGLSILDALVTQIPDDLRALHARSALLVVASDVHDELGEEDLVADRLARAVDDLRDLRRRAPRIPTYGVDLLGTLAAQALHASNRGDQATVDAALEEGLRLSPALGTPEEDPARLLEARTRLFRQSAVWAHKRGRHEDALRFCSEAEALLNQQAMAQWPRQRRAFLEASLADVRAQAEHAAGRAGWQARERESRLRSIDLLNSLLPTDDPAVERTLWVYRGRLAERLAQQGDVEQALGVVQEVVAYRSSLLERKPENAIYGSDLVRGLLQLARLESARGAAADAEATLRRATEVAEGLHGRGRSVSALCLAADVWGQRRALAVARKDMAQAEVASDQEIRARGLAFEAEPAVALHAEELAAALQARGQVAERREDWGEALRRFADLRDHYRNALRDGLRGHLAFQRGETWAMNRMAAAQEHLGRPAEALALLQESLRLRLQGLQSDPKDVVWRSGVTFNYGEIGRLAEVVGGPEAGLMHWRNVVAQHDLLAAIGVPWGEDGWVARLNLGRMELASGDEHRALQLLTAVAESPPTPSSGLQEEIAESRLLLRRARWLAGGEEPDSAAGWATLARLLSRRERSAEAFQAWRGAIAHPRAEDAPPGMHLEAARAGIAMARALESGTRDPLLTEVMALLEEHVRLRRAALPGGDPEAEAALRRHLQELSDPAGEFALLVASPRFGSWWERLAGPP